MLTGFYTVASGVLMQQRTLDVIANNMSNDKTPGFKGERVVSTTFEQTLLTRMEGSNTGAIGKGSPIRIVRDVPISFEQGMLETTERPYDMAINGVGFFNIQAADGQQYMTRNGNFDIDKDGILILRNAGKVMGEKGEIKLDSSDFVVLEDGTVKDAYSDKVYDKLLINAPNEGTQLKKFSNGMYQVDPTPPEPLGTQPEAEGEQQPAVAPGVTQVELPNIQQGVLENSNIDWNAEMSLMMETQRTFQSCSKALQIIDQLNQKTVGIANQ